MTVSPLSILPAVPPVLFVAVTDVAVGFVASTVKVTAAVVPVRPPVSVCVAWAV